MLILQRRVGEKIVVGGEIEITVTEVTKRGVRLAVRAPSGVTILRGETHDAVVASNARAALAGGTDFRHRARVAFVRPAGGAAVIRLSKTRFGDIEVDDSRAVTFPRGLIGFPDARKFVLLEPRGSSRVAWLQSIDVPELAFPVVDGACIGQAYPQPDSPELARNAGLGSSELALLVIVAMSGQERSLVANMLAPLIVDLESRTGAQVVLDHRVFSASAPLRAPAAQGAP